MKPLKHILILIFWIGWVPLVTAQYSEAKDYIISGNENYENGDFSKAEARYKIALSESPNSIKADYNLGNALYKQQKFQEARAHYDRVIENALATDSDKQKAYHNIGKSYLDEMNPEKAIESLKESLKLNPADDETRYNYALAKKMLEDKENQKNKQDSDENSDEKDENEDGDDEKQDKDGKEDDSKDEGNRDQSQNSDEENDEGSRDEGNRGDDQGTGDLPQREEISKGLQGDGSDPGQTLNREHQEGVLEALRQQEQETLKKIISQKASKRRSKKDKDW